MGDATPAQFLDRMERHRARMAHQPKLPRSLLSAHERQALAVARVEEVMRSKVYHFASKKKKIAMREECFNKKLGEYK